MNFAFSLFVCNQYEVRHSFISNRLELYHYFRVKLFQIGQWESLQLAPVPFNMPLSFFTWFLIFWHKMFRLIFTFLCPGLEAAISPRILSSC